MVGTLSLVLVLFTDALSLNLSEVRKHRLLSFLVLGPGTIFSALLIRLFLLVAAGPAAGGSLDSGRRAGLPPIPSCYAPYCGENQASILVCGRPSGWREE